MATLTRPSWEGRPVQSDEHVRGLVTRLLRQSGYSTLSRLRCDVANGVVTLHGWVPSFHLKQLAQTILLNAEPIRGVDNRIEVREIFSKEQVGVA